MHRLFVNSTIHPAIVFALAFIILRANPFPKPHHTLIPIQKEKRLMVFGVGYIHIHIGKLVSHLNLCEINFCFTTDSSFGML